MCLLQGIFFIFEAGSLVYYIYRCTCSLNKDLEDTDLQSCVYNHFEQWGHLLGVKVLKDWLKRPYAFVQYQVN